MSIAGLERLTVTSFPSSSVRQTIFAEFRRLIDDLKAFNLQGQIWADGSFLTDKSIPEVDDMDLSFIVTEEHLQAQTPEARDFVYNALNGGNRYSPVLDTYIAVMFPKGDPRQAAVTDDYWAEKWLKGWDDRLKGFAVIVLGETDLWHRLYAS